MRKYEYPKGTGNYDTRICQALNLRNGHRFVYVKMERKMDWEKQTSEQTAAKENATDR
jgi:hypothetical protein